MRYEDAREILVRLSENTILTQKTRDAIIRVLQEVHRLDSQVERMGEEISAVEEQLMYAEVEIENNGIE